MKTTNKSRNKTNAPEHVTPNKNASVKNLNLIK